MKVKHYVYRVFDKGGQLLYVGATVYPYERPRQHAQRSAWFADAAEWEFTEYPDFYPMMRAERHAIETEHPLHNVRHNQRAAA